MRSDTSLNSLALKSLHQAPLADGDDDGDGDDDTFSHQNKSPKGLEDTLVCGVARDSYESSAEMLDRMSQTISRLHIP